MAEKEAKALQLDAAVFGASVQLPAFDKLEPVSWFAVADANFALRKVSDELTKYYYILSKLDSSTLRKLSAFLKRPRGDSPYQEIRSELCEAFEPSMEQRLDTLLAVTDSGEESLRAFGLQLQRLLGDATTDDILKRIFLRSIPHTIVTAISGSLEAKFSVVLQVADRAQKASATSARAAPAAATVAAVSGPSTPAPRRGGRGGRQRGGRSGAQDHIKSVQLCHFHLRFGDSARRCAQGCVRWANQQRDAQVSQVEELLDGEDASIGASSENC